MALAHVNSDSLISALVQEVLLLLLLFLFR